MPLRIEAAAWAGRPVSFEIFGPWRPEQASTETPRSGPDTASTLTIVIVLLGALLLALRNFRSGRGDLSGAVRLAVLIFLCTVVAYEDLAHHTPLLTAEFGTLTVILGTSFIAAAAAWALYMATEPYVRRNWPQALIGWSRALAGHFRDPLANGHILAGIAVGIASAVIHSAARTATGASLNSDPRPLTAPFVLFGAWSADFSEPPVIALGLFFVFVLLRLLLRRTWLAAGVIILAFAVLAESGANIRIEVVLADTATFVLLMAVSIRFGILALAVAIIASRIPGRYPVTSNFSAWYAPRGWLEIAMVLVVALWSFRNALGGRKVLKGDFLDR